MKKPKFLRLRLLVGLSPGGNSHRRGVAIITVLAIISLMAVLVVSFFNMAQSTKISAIGSVEMQRQSQSKWQHDARPGDRKRRFPVVVQMTEVKLQPDQEH